jgi:hypothetical protein
MSPQHVQHLGFIIHEGLKGRHILFDPEMIRSSLPRGERASHIAGKEDRLAVKAALDILTELPNLSEKRAFVASLPDEIRDLLIYYYFQFLDRCLQELRPTLH